MSTYKETTDNRTYRILHAGQVFSCCIHCKRRSRNKGYGGFNNGPMCHPNWKLVSKNRKQWQKKPIRIKEKNFSKFTYKTIVW